MYKIVLLRHGESTWNKENRFTGWTDVDLSERGVEEARAAGHLLKASGFEFELAFTSVLRRAIRTLWLALETMDRVWIPIHNAWRLNERHYGALQGLNKAETAAQYGEEQVLLWRRSYSVPPPALTREDARFPGHDPRYRGLQPDELPLTECLRDTVERVVPYWQGRIVPEIQTGRSVLIAAHGNSIRALIKYLDNISEEKIVGLNIPTATPLVYELDAKMKPIRNYYLGDQKQVEAAMQAVANQGRAGT